MSFRRIGGLAGIAFAVLILGPNLALAPAGLPIIGDPPHEVAAFFAEHRGIIELTSALTPLVWLVATTFGAAAVVMLWPIERARGEGWSLVGFAGLVLQNVTFAGVVATRLALTTADGAAATESLWALNEAFFTLNGTFLATAMIGFSVSGLRSRVVRRWHGRLGIVAATLQFSSASLMPLVFDDPGQLSLLGLAGWLLWVIWLAQYGVVLIRHSAPTDARPHRTTAGIVGAS